VITEDFFNSGFPNWGAAETIPDWIPGLDIDWTELYKALGSVEGIAKITLDQKI
jgi:hypothetical protein